MVWCVARRCGGARPSKGDCGRGPPPAAEDRRQATPRRGLLASQPALSPALSPTGLHNQTSLRASIEETKKLTGQRDELAGNTHLTANISSMVPALFTGLL